MHRSVLSTAGGEDGLSNVWTDNVRQSECGLRNNRSSIKRLRKKKDRKLQNTSWYICQPSSTKQEREMTTICSRCWIHGWTRRRKRKNASCTVPYCPQLVERTASQTCGQTTLGRANAVSVTTARPSRD